MKRTAFLAVGVLSSLSTFADAQLPQRTASTYGDWVVRCEVAPGPPTVKSCDLAQLFESKSQAPPAVSQIMITRPNKKEPVRMVVQLQANILIAPGIRV